MGSKYPKKPVPTQVVDPIALDVPLSVLSLAVSILSLLFQVSAGRRGKHLKALRRLRTEVLRLQNCLDDVVLTVDRALPHDDSETASDSPLVSGPLNASTTMLRLRRADCVRWRDLQAKLVAISSRVYAVIREAQEEIHARGESSEAHELATEVVRPFDELFLRISTHSFTDFVLDLRTALDRLDEFLGDLIRNNSPGRRGE